MTRKSSLRIKYAIRLLLERGKLFTDIEKECLSLVWGVHTLRPYLVSYRFVVTTEHKTMKRRTMWVTLRGGTRKQVKWKRLGLPVFKPYGWGHARFTRQDRVLFYFPRWDFMLVILIRIFLFYSILDLFWVIVFWKEEHCILHWSYKM